MGHIGSKTRSPSHIVGKPFVHSRGHIFCLMLMKLGHTVALIKSCTGLKMVMSSEKLGHWVKFKEKPSVLSRGNIFNLIFMKPGQNICLDEISDRFENG